MNNQQKSRNSIVQSWKHCLWNLFPLMQCIQWIFNEAKADWAVEVRPTLYIPKHLGYFLILKVMSQSSRVEKTICGKLMLLPCTPLTQKSLGTAHSSYLWSKGQTYLTLAVISHRFSIQKLFIASFFSQWEKSSD